LKALISITACLAILLSVESASAQVHPTYQSLWDAAAHDTNCVQSNYDNFVLFSCKKELTFWYFTKSNHPAHPGVVKRALIQQPDGSWVGQENGSSFASDSAQPAFKAWLAQIADLDRQLRKALEKQHAISQSGRPN
jgi:hypothetical protein